MARKVPEISRRLMPIDPLRFYTVTEIWSGLQALKPHAGNYRDYQRWILEELRGKNKYNVKEIDGAHKNRYLIRGIDLIRARVDLGVDHESENERLYERALYNEDSKLREKFNIK